MTKGIDKVTQRDYDVTVRNKQQKLKGGKSMTEKMRNEQRVKEAEDFLKRWMSLTPMKKERAKGYLECLEGTEQYQKPQKTT